MLTGNTVQLVAEQVETLIYLENDVVTAGTGLTGGGTNGDVTVNVDVGTTANKIMQIYADGKLTGVIATEVHKENNKIATAGTIIFYKWSWLWISAPNTFLFKCKW